MVRDRSGSHNSAKAIPGDPALPSLRREWGWVAAFSGLLLLAGYGLLRMLWSPRFALQWALLAALILAYLLALLWRSLELNHLPGEPRLRPTLGPGNRLTIVRGILLALLGGFLFLPWPPGLLGWIPGTLYASAALMDYADGYVARRTGSVTLLGGAIDTELDGLGVLIAPLLAVWYGQLPPWYVLVSAARYVYVFVIWLRKRLGQPVYELPPSAIRRALAGYQMGLVSFVLFPPLQPPGTWLVGTVFMIPFLAGFLRDGLAVAGAIDPASPRYSSLARWTTIGATSWLPLALRLIGAGTAALIGVRAIAQGHTVVGSACMALAILILAGIAGRIAALALLLLVGLALEFDAATLMVLLLIANSALVVLGTGALSLWQPEELFLRRHYGSRRDVL